jgi:hypothetical protein
MSVKMKQKKFSLKKYAYITNLAIYGSLGLIPIVIISLFTLSGSISAEKTNTTDIIYIFIFFTIILACMLRIVHAGASWKVFDDYMEYQKFNGKTLKILFNDIERFEFKNNAIVIEFKSINGKLSKASIPILMYEGEIELISKLKKIAHD